MTSNTPLIIAEAGCNHNGDIKKAFKLIDEAKKAKADFVKFQTYKSDELLLKNTRKASYQASNTNKKISQFQRLKKAEFNFNQFIDLYKYAKKKDIRFLSSFFDIPSLKLLDHIDIDYIKISSSEITNLPLLNEISKYKKKIILSTGMSSLAEIKNAIKNLKTPKKDLTLLHCISIYPTEIKDTRLGYINVLKENFNVNVGFSDHTRDYYAAISAIGLGVNIFEKHFTLNKNLSGGDHKFSLNPRELSEYCHLIKTLSHSINQKNITERPRGEKEISLISRKSLCINKDLKKDSILTLKDLSIKRPGTGISPTKMKNIIGKKLRTSLKKDTLLKYKYLF